MVNYQYTQQCFQELFLSHYRHLQTPQCIQLIDPQQEYLGNHFIIQYIGMIHLPLDRYYILLRAL